MPTAEMVGAMHQPPSILRIVSLAIWRASGNLAGSLPPAWAMSGRPPPPPPTAAATGRIHSPALSFASLQVLANARHERHFVVALPARQQHGRRRRLAADLVDQLPHQVAFDAGHFRDDDRHAADLLGRFQQRLAGQRPGRRRVRRAAFPVAATSALSAAIRCGTASGATDSSRAASASACFTCSYVGFAGVDGFARPLAA